MESSEYRYVYNLVQDYLKYILQEPHLGPAPSRVAHVLRNTASFLQKENEENLKPCLDTLVITSVDAARRIFIKVMDEEFADGNTNWGRILTIFMFGGILSKRLQEHGVQLSEDNKEQISYFITDYIINNKAEWIEANGGWVLASLTTMRTGILWLSRRYRTGPPICFNPDLERAPLPKTDSSSSVFSDASVKKCIVSPTYNPMD